MIRILSAFIIFILCHSTFAKNTSNWQYKSFPALSKNSPEKRLEPYVLKFGKNQLAAIMGRESGTHRIWGVDQIYLNPKSQKQKIFIKYNVEISPNAPIGSWVKLNKGQIIHLKQINKRYTAYFAQGFNSKELLELQSKLTNKSVSSNINYSWLIACANAEVAESTGDDTFLNEPQKTETDRGLLARAGDVVSCVGADAIDAAVGRGRAI
jgi:hypothetical protein